MRARQAARTTRSSTRSSSTRGRDGARWGPHPSSPGGLGRRDLRPAVRPARPLRGLRSGRRVRCRAGGCVAAAAGSGARRAAARPRTRSAPAARRRCRRPGRPARRSQSAHLRGLAVEDLRQRRQRLGAVGLRRLDVGVLAELVPADDRRSRRARSPCAASNSRRSVSPPSRATDALPPIRRASKPGAAGRDPEAAARVDRGRHARRASPGSRDGGGVRRDDQ